MRATEQAIELKDKAAQKIEDMEAATRQQIEEAVATAWSSARLKAQHN
jgi:hypothetical protein